jgi:hypothetical protein
MIPVIKPIKYESAAAVFDVNPEAAATVPGAGAAATAAPPETDVGDEISGWLDATTGFPQLPQNPDP